MRNILLLCLAFGWAANVNGQSGAHKKEPTLAFQAGLVDFLSASRVRQNSSLTQVMGNNQWAKPNEMDFALGGSFINGINDYLDYSVNTFFTFTNYPIRNKKPPFENGIYGQVDASVHLKLLPDNYILVPYLSAGVGGAMIGSRFEAFMPFGAGMQLGLGEGYFIFSNFQYRVPVTAGANYHFQYSLGVGFPIN